METTYVVINDKYSLERCEGTFQEVQESLIEDEDRAQAVEKYSFGKKVIYIGHELVAVERGSENLPW